MELGKVTDYVQNVLGLNAFEDIQFKDEDRFIPNICILTFSMAGYMIEDVPCVLLSPFEDSTQVSILMKRADLVRQAVNRPYETTYRQSLIHSGAIARKSTRACHVLR